MKIFFLLLIMSLPLLIVSCVEDETQKEQDVPSSDQEYPSPQKELPSPGKD